MSTTVRRETGDRWITGEAFDHVADSGRVGRRAQTTTGDWSVYEVEDGEPVGVATLCHTVEAAVVVADAIAEGKWR